MDEAAAGQTPPASEPVSSLENKGIRFEDLIEKLIRAMFPGEKWRRTGKSYDGKKDFVFPAEESLPDQKWAECKNYKSNLSLNVIAPTLIMGAIENINTIFFFSYSPLNDNAVDNLLRYAKQNQKDIRIYDGPLLEYLICIHAAAYGISDFFSDHADFDHVREEIKRQPLSIRLTLRDLNGIEISSLHRFARGEHFFLQITVRNLTWETIPCSLTAQSSRKGILHFEYDRENFSIREGEIAQYSIPCEAMQEGEAKLAVELTAKLTAQTKKAKTVRKAIKVSDESYLAWCGHMALAARDAGLKHLRDRDKRLLLITGKAGTGKSTLLQILLDDPEVREQYRILKIDSNRARNEQIRALLSQALGVRDENRPFKEQDDQEQNGDDKKTLNFLISNYAKGAKEIVDQLIKFYDREHPYLVVLDDAQNMSGPHADLIQELVGCENEANVPIYYLLTLDESVCEVKNLLSELSWDEAFQNRELHSVQLAAFQRADILAYLNTQYGLKDIGAYFEGPELELSPLELHTFCCGLRDKHVIERELQKQTYQITDPSRFSEQINLLRRSKVPLKEIYDTPNHGGMSGFILKYIYVAGYLSEKLRERNQTAVNKLIDQGILKDDGGIVTFYHREIRERARELLDFSEEDCADIIADPETSEGAKALCNLEQFGKLWDGERFLKAFLETAQTDFKPELRSELCRLIFQKADQLSGAGLLPAGLHFVRANFQMLSEESRHSAFFTFLRTVADTAMHCKRCEWDLNAESVEDMAYFLKKFWDRALSSHQSPEDMPRFSEYEERFSKLEHITEPRRSFWLCHYANRAAIAADRISDPTMPEPLKVSELYARSRSYFEGAGKNLTLDLQLTVDEFNRHYIYRHDLTSLYVQETYRKLCGIRAEEQDGPQGDPMVLENPMVLNYHLYLLEYLQIQMGIDDPAPSFPERLGEAIRQCGSPFYEIKLRIMEIYRFIELDNYSGAAAQLTEAYAFAYKKGLRASIYKLTCIKSQLLLLQPSAFSETTSASQAALALAQMLDLHKNNINALLREAFVLAPMAQRIIDAGEDLKALPAAERQPDQTKALLCQLDAYLRKEDTSEQAEKRFGTKSYFYLCGLDFPSI